MSYKTEKEIRSNSPRITLGIDALLGYIWGPQCAVRSNDGVRCPETPAYQVERNGEDMALCKRCYQNAIAGAYGDDPIKLIREITA